MILKKMSVGKQSKTKFFFQKKKTLQIMLKQKKSSRSQETFYSPKKTRLTTIQIFNQPQKTIKNKHTFTITCKKRDPSLFKKHKKLRKS
jgi:hypothetical protein